MKREFDTTTAQQQRIEPMKQNYIEYSRGNGNRRATPPDRRLDDNLEHRRARFDPPSEQRNAVIIGLNPEVIQNHQMSQGMQASGQMSGIYPPLYTISQQQFENQNGEPQTSTKTREVNEADRANKYVEQTSGQQRLLTWSPPGALY